MVIHIVLGRVIIFARASSDFLVVFLWFSYDHDSQVADPKVVDPQVVEIQVAETKLVFAFSGLAN